jgi:hypothetical protein
MGWLNAFTVPSGAALKKLEIILTFCGSGGSCWAGLNTHADHATESDRQTVGG